MSFEWQVDWKQGFQQASSGMRQWHSVTYLQPITRAPIKLQGTIVTCNQGFIVRDFNGNHVVCFYDTAINLLKEITITVATPKNTLRIIPLGNCYLFCFAGVAHVYSFDGNEIAQYPCPDATDLTALVDYHDDQWDDSVVLSPVNGVLQELRWDAISQTINDSVTYQMPSHHTTSFCLFAVSEEHVICCYYSSGRIYCWKRGEKTLLWEQSEKQCSDRMLLSIAGGYLFHTYNMGPPCMVIRDILSGGVKIGSVPLIGVPIVSQPTRVQLNVARETGDYSQIRPVLFFAVRLAWNMLTKAQPLLFDFATLTVLPQGQQPPKGKLRLPQDGIRTLGLFYHDGIVWAVNNNAITIVDLEHQRVICKTPNRDPSRLVPFVSVSPDRMFIVVRHNREVEICEPRSNDAPKWLSLSPFRR